MTMAACGWQSLRVPEPPEREEVAIHPLRNFSSRLEQDKPSMQQTPECWLIAT
jgi:hypothetical protein